MNTIEELFEAIKNSEYVVLRNYENLRKDISSEKHPDIDFLCADRNELIEKLSLKSRGKIKDCIHFKAAVADKEVAVDLREVGDGYYDEKWEKHILKNRVLFDNLCYVPDETDSHFSLLYHALIQKKKLGDDYRERLKISNRENEIARLDSFMQENGYSYTYPENFMGIFNTKDVDKKLIEKNVIKKIKHGIGKMLRALK